MIGFRHSERRDGYFLKCYKKVPITDARSAPLASPAPGGALNGLQVASMSFPAL